MVIYTKYDTALLLVNDMTKTSIKLNQGLTLWLTGLSGSGKSTLATALKNKILSLNPQFPLEYLDGDEIRDNLNQDLGFSREDRMKNIRRIAYLASKISKHNVLVIVPVIAPYQEARDMAKSMQENYLEVYVEASIDKVSDRDVKGLYAKAKAGEIENFTGISDPYDIPEKPDIVINTEKDSIEESCNKLFDFLVEQAYIELAK